MIRTLLQNNAEKRPSFTRILTNQWLASFKQPTNRINYHDIDDDIIDQMKELFSKEQIIDDLAKNRHNSVTTTYFILLKRKVYKEETQSLYKCAIQPKLFYDPISDKTFLDIQKMTISNRSESLHKRDGSTRQSMISRNCSISAKKKVQSSISSPSKSPRRKLIITCDSPLRNLSIKKVDESVLKSNNMSIIAESIEHSILLSQPVTCVNKRANSIMVPLKQNYFLNNGRKSNGAINRSSYSKNRSFHGSEFEELNLIGVHDGPFDLGLSSFKKPDEILKMLKRALMRLDVKSKMHGTYRVVCSRDQFKFDIEIVNIKHFTQMNCLKFKCIAGGDSEDLRFLQEKILKMLVL